MRILLIINRDTRLIRIVMFGIAGIVAGIVLVLISLFLIFFFPSTAELQPYAFDKNGVLLGFLLFFIGIVLLFLP